MLSDFGNARALDANPSFASKQLGNFYAGAKTFRGEENEELVTNCSSLLRLEVEVVLPGFLQKVALKNGIKDDGLLPTATL